MIEIGPYLVKHPLLIQDVDWTNLNVKIAYMSTYQITKLYKGKVSL